MKINRTVGIICLCASALCLGAPWAHAKYEKPTTTAAYVEKESAALQKEEQRIVQAALIRHRLNVRRENYYLRPDDGSLSQYKNESVPVERRD